MSTSYLDNYYARLGVRRTASLEDVQHAYRAAARKYHPDANPHPGAKELFLLVQEAYNVLSDPTRRRSYDASLPPDVETPPDLMVNALYSRGQVTPGEPEQVVYVLLDLMAAESGAARRPPLNVSLVLDASTSMAGGRLGEVLRSAGQFLEQLKPQDTLSVVAFNDRAEVVLPAQAVQDPQHLRARLAALQARGGTEILQGLQGGLAELHRHMSPGAVNHLVLVTDGRTYGDEAGCLRLAAQAAAVGVSISVIGIGEEWNETFADQLAAKAGGVSLYADKNTQITKLLQRKLTGLNQTYAGNVKLHYQPGPGCRLDYVFRLAPDSGILQVDSPVFLGDIPLEGSLSVLLEFSVDASSLQQGNLTLAQGELRLDMLHRVIPATTARFELSRPVLAMSAPEPPPRALVNAIGRLSLYRMQERAREELEAGDGPAAAKRLRMLATRLLSSGERGLARKVLSAAKEIKDGGSLSEKTGKQIKYGTRALVGSFDTQPAAE
ncbi:MAG: VWA domain-containing protein [Anaerolineales bacterium]|nr:VWA domain-containing protein [Anaerolineales bacterium]